MLCTVVCSVCLHAAVFDVLTGEVVQTLMTDQYRNCVRDVSWHPTQPAQLVSTSVSWTSTIASAVTTSYLLCFFVHNVFSPVATLCFSTSTSHSPSLSLLYLPSLSLSPSLSVPLSLLYLPSLSLSPSLSVPLASSLPPLPSLSPSCMVTPGAVGWHSTAMDSQQEIRLCTRPTETVL